jgi:hypothetical protein
LQDFFFGMANDPAAEIAASATDGISIKKPGLAGPFSWSE